MATITIKIEGAQSRSLQVKEGSTLLEIITLSAVQSSHPIIAAYVDNRIKELNYRVFNSVSIRYVDITSFTGSRVYRRTISLVMQCAVEELMEGHTLHIRHSMGTNGLYCEVEQRSDSSITTLSPEMVSAIEAHMREIVEMNAPIVRHKLPTSEVRELYEERGYDDKVTLLETRPRLYSELYRLRGSVGYLYGALAPSTKYVSRFELEPYHRGFYLRLPLRSEPEALSCSPHQSKMFDIFQIYQRWVDVMGVQSVGALNSKILAGDSSEMIKLSEALSERAIAAVADRIAQAHRTRGVKLVLLAGPSSSGKTTTARRIGVQLQVLGYRPALISMDDYFVDRELTPLDENGERDFEALEAVDLVRFNRDINLLFDGESVTLPCYDFVSGRSLMHEKPMQLSPNSILIVEGIHGLNPKLTPNIPSNIIYRLYTSCFTTIAMDDISHIASVDNRLLRRLSRDYTQRGNSGQATLQRWASVRRGEERHIFPYQENADIMINTAQFYEIAVLKPFVERILREVPNTGEEYDEAVRMLKFLDNFIEMESHEIPPTSTLREFIGGSSF